MLQNIVQIVDLCGNAGCLPEASAPLRAVLVDSVGALVQTVLSCQCGVGGVDELVEVCLVSLPLRLQVSNLGNHVGVRAGEVDVTVLLGSCPGDGTEWKRNFHFARLDCDSADSFSEAKERESEHGC